MSKLTYVFLIATGCLLLEPSAASAASPSFGCKAAKSLSETTICANDDLAALDQKISEL